MLVRYGKNKNGAPVKIAEIYTLKEHGIGKEQIDPEAVSIIRRLVSHGYKAYVVGGAVRDLLLGKKPKDFDLATDAAAARIRQCFRNSRIIGRRFPLVHVFYRDKIIEVSSFRAHSDNNKTGHGTAENDAWTRDFSINAMFYDPEKEQIIDYVGAMKDIKNKTVSPLIGLNTIFTEDPVRMLRAVKYGVMTGFNLTKGLKSTIEKQRELLAECSSSRLTEELLKILASGYSKPIFDELLSFGLLDKLMPVYGAVISASGGGGRGDRTKALAALGDLDAVISEGRPVARAAMLHFLVKGLMETLVDWKQEREILYKECFYKIKNLLKPLTPPNAEVEGAARLLFVERGLQPLHRRFLLKK